MALMKQTPHGFSARRCVRAVVHNLGRIAGPLVWVALAVAAQAQSTRVVITSEPGYTITWDGNNGGFRASAGDGAGPTNNPALASNGTVPFGSSEYGTPHFIINVNDGFYGNAASWISDFTIPDPNPFIGLNFNKTVAIESIAWGRDNTTDDNGGVPFFDRSVGTYTLQVTTVANPDVGTPEAASPSAGWVTIGTVQYTAGADNKFFTASYRHRFDVAAGGQPISATGIRIKVSDANLDLDEIEVNPGPDPTAVLATYIEMKPVSGFMIEWDGNDGKFLSTNSPAPAPINRALASQGTKAFGSSEYGTPHFITNVIDGLYGNSHSWIADFTKPDTNAFIGLDFGAAVAVQNIAWSRDNGDDPDGQEFIDRCLGVYTLQITRVTGPNANTPETGDPTTGWQTIGTVNYKTAGPPFTPYLRHRFTLSSTNGDSVVATGIRIKVPDTNTDIDEIEINPKVALELDNLADLIEFTADGNYAITWDGNDGDFFSAASGARCPDNAALASNGSVAFGSSELDFGGAHLIRKVNDGLYGNTYSWISDRGVGGGTDQDPWIGVKFNKTVQVSSVAWSRDNGDTTEAGCGGTCTDRCIGIYTLQVTTVASPTTNTVETGDPATGWITIATVNYKAAAAPAFRPSMRHRFDVSLNGQPIPATAFRLKVSDGGTDIDEIEINPTAQVVAPPVTDLIAIQSASGFSLTWDGNDGEFASGDAIAPAPSNAALATNGSIAFGSSQYGTPHFITNVIDGLYANKHSWISDFTKPDTNAFVGVAFPQPVAIRAVAWGRDNGDNTEGPTNPNTDRCLGTYILQVTKVASPGVATAETGDASTGWATVGTVQYKAAFKTLFNPYLRHRFNVSTDQGIRVLATGVRIKVSDGGIAIDEIEVNPSPAVDANIIVMAPQPNYLISWDGNDGEYGNLVGPPDNLALTNHGTVAFGSSEYGTPHFIPNVNDGLYGNSHSWIATPDDAGPYVGLTFATNSLINSIAWGRDNTGQAKDRNLGDYILQVTTMPNPGLDTTETGDPPTGWASIGTLTYRGADTPVFHHYLRHSYDVSFNGQPIAATGLRILVPASSGIDIDEIEVNTQLPTPAPKVTLSISRQGNTLTITWTGGGTVQAADDVAGPWADVTDSSNPYTPATSAAKKFYRVRQ